MLYFDHAATTPVHPKVIEKIDEVSRLDYGNPSSIYSSGRAAKSIIEHARNEIAKMIDAKASEIYFTGSGTESNNIVIWSLLHQQNKHVITSSIEHPAVLKVLDELSIFGISYDILPVDSTGLVNPADLESTIRKDTALISIMYVNNEVGTIQNIEDLIDVAQSHTIPFHSDCVQAVGKLPISTKNINPDYMSFSAHKFYGPKGIGFLYKKSGAHLKPLIIGGSQESNVRAGTENISGIAGLGIAAELVNTNLNNRIEHLSELENYFKNTLIKQSPEIIFHGNSTQHVPGLCSIALPNHNNEIILAKLDRKGIEISNGSACSSGTVGVSPILNAMGIDDKINQSTIRISFGRGNTIEDVSLLIEALSEFSHA
ncbi:MAG: cysteine desulfurase family protein [Candidatus Neomarinimicrobiota bacterium]|nr:cysteine desulfurase family protein [Candidatus Neomarinimicrobiota bacterium]